MALCALMAGIMVYVPFLRYSYYNQMIILFTEFHQVVDPSEVNSFIGLFGMAFGIVSMLGYPFGGIFADKFSEKWLPLIEEYGMQIAIENHTDTFADEILWIVNRLNHPHIGSRLDKRPEQFKESIDKEMKRLLARFDAERPALDDEVRLALRKTLSSTGLGESWFDKIEELAAAASE